MDFGLLSIDNIFNLNLFPETQKCEDRISNIAGSMSCKAFLRSFAYQYCKHKYIKKNWCAFHEIYCLNTGRSRTNKRGRTLIFWSTNSNSTSSSTNNTTSTTSDKVFKHNIKYAVNNNIRNKFVNENRLRQTYNHYSGNQNNTFVNPIVSQRNSTSSIINRINLSALPSVFQQQSRFRTNRARFYRSVQDDDHLRWR